MFGIVLARQRGTARCARGMESPAGPAKGCSGEDVSTAASGEPANDSCAEPKPRGHNLAMARQKKKDKKRKLVDKLVDARQAKVTREDDASGSQRQDDAQEQGDNTGATTTMSITRSPIGG